MDPNFYIFYIIGVSASKLDKNANFELDVLLFANFDEDHLTFIFFCKESESAIRIKKIPISI